MAAAVDPRKPGFSTGAGMFVRVLALSHLAAFGSFWIQERGLVGPRGILPAGRLFEIAREQLGARAMFELPSLCWLFGTGRFLDVLCITGIAASVLLFAGRAQVLCLAVLWSGYLSLLAAGQVFFEFQWDSASARMHASCRLHRSVAAVALRARVRAAEASPLPCLVAAFPAHVHVRRHQSSPAAT